MRVKKFIADNYSDALLQVKRELGEEALIISTRSIRPNQEVEGVGQSTQVEITATVDFSTVEEWESGGSSAAQNDESAVFKEDDVDMKFLMFTLLSQSDRAQAMGVRSHQLGLYSRLVRSGVDEKLIPKMMEKAGPDNPDASPDTRSDARRLLALMKRVLDCKGGIRLDPGRTKKVALVGPTGAGKTTTVAKLAADFVYRQKKKVALISLDTYRVGAVDPLRIYGDIMRIPVDMAADRQELQNLVRRHSGKDIILIDTTGRSHRDRAYASQLKQTFEGVGDVESHLVLNVGAQEKLHEASFDQYSLVGLKRVLFTKVDEGLSFGQLFNFSLRTRLPFSYLTTGQQVPEDIEVASRERVIRLIFN